MMFVTQHIQPGQIKTQTHPSTQQEKKKERKTYLYVISWVIEFTDEGTMARNSDGHKEGNHNASTKPSWSEKVIHAITHK